MNFAAARVRVSMGILVAVTCLLMGCQIIGELPSDPAPTAAVNPADGYMLEGGNKLRVTIFNEPNLSGEFTLDSAGNLSFPLVGNVPAAGLTANMLGDKLQTLLKQGAYLKDPSVTVEIESFRSIYVLGEVKQPGEVPFTTGLTVLSAVAHAGGYDYRASIGEVALYRMEGGEQKKYHADELTPVMPGDIIRVLERRY